MSPPAILHNSPSNSPRATTLSPEAVRSPPSEVVTANGAGPSTAEATGDTIASAPKPTFVPRAKLLGEKLTSDDSPGFGPFGGPLGRGRGSGRGRGIVFGNRIGGLSSSGPSAPSPSTSLLMAKSGSGGTRTPVLSMLDSIEFVPASPAALAVSDALSKPPTTATGPNPITKVVSSPVVVSPSTSSPSFSLVNYGEVDSDEEEDGGTPGSKRTPALALTPVQSSNGATEVKRRKVEGEQ